MEPKPSNLKYSITRAINAAKAKPIKEKHIRMTILGSFYDKGGDTFWLVVSTIPIHCNVMIIWRFCYVFHKVMREGHPNFITDSQRFRQWIASLGPSWAVGISNFGNTVGCYCSLVAKRLEFHAKNWQFLGDLQLKEEAWSSIESGNVDYTFQIAEDIMDNLAEILELQTKVFSSMKSEGDHNQLSALIPCIEDSQQFLDVLLKLLKKLHHSNNMSTCAAKLNENREKFYIQYSGLREFYKHAGSLVYFKQLTQVPLLSEVPPTFAHSQETSSSDLIGLSNPFVTPDRPTSAQIIFTNMLRK